MIGNGILAFAVIAVVVIFTYMSMRSSQQKAEVRHFIEQYTVTLAEGFDGRATSVYVNDSLLANQTLGDAPLTLSFGRFDEHMALLIVDNETERIAFFELSESGGDYRFVRRDDEVSMQEEGK